MHDLPARVGPGSELEVALLIVKGEPGDVNLARRLRRIGMVSMITINRWMALDGMVGVRWRPLFSANDSRTKGNPSCTLTSKRSIEFVNLG